LPEFKAGVHAGVVTVAEIGDIKREIAYHGDVVNTASRLRSACNEFEKELLASEYVVRNIDKTEGHEIKEIGSVKLKGKKNSIKVFSIE
jgi:adenylate cyclase